MKSKIALTMMGIAIALIVMIFLVLRIWDGAFEAPVAQYTTTPALTPTPTPRPTSASSFSPVPTTTHKPAPISGVPFTSQAPMGGWEDQRQQDGCEEASALMAIRWVQGKGLTSSEALREILAISDYEEATYGSYHDTNAQDTVERIFKGYFKFDGATAVLNITAEDIKAALAQGKLVLVPLNGQKLGNPNFTAPGPERHMLVIISYDSARDEFVTNDPGTRNGKGYRYKVSVLERALLNYPTGDHVPVTNVHTAMITVEK